MCHTQSFYTYLYGISHHLTLWYCHNQTSLIPVTIIDDYGSSGQSARINRKFPARPLIKLRDLVFEENTQFDSMAMNPTSGDLTANDLLAQHLLAKAHDGQGQQR